MKWKGKQMSNKTWRSVTKMLPPEDAPVLALLNDEEIPYVAAWDGDIWYEYHTSQPLHNVGWWMFYPFNPND
jgi:hypothetical protein